MKIADKISNIVGIRILNGEYEKVFKEMETSGRYDFKTVSRIITVLLQEFEALDKKVSNLENEKNLHQKSNE